jgi:hypothetical protein
LTPRQTGRPGAARAEPGRGREKNSKKRRKKKRRKEKKRKQKEKEKGNKKTWTAAARLRSYLPCLNKTLALSEKLKLSQPPIFFSHFFSQTRAK